MSTTVSWRERWTASEAERRDRALAGELVLANLHKDIRLVHWAHDQRRAVRIHRFPRVRRVVNPLGNPYLIRDGGREEAVRRFREEHLPTVLDMVLALRPGSVLLCYCYPADCHGEAIIEAWEAGHRLPGYVVQPDLSAT